MKIIAVIELVLENINSLDIRPDNKLKMKETYNVDKYFIYFPQKLTQPYDKING